MRRREFLKDIAGTVLAWPRAAHAQQGERVRRIGALIARAAAPGSLYNSLRWEMYL
jgi:hypothetical protein